MINLTPILILGGLRFWLDRYGLAFGEGDNGFIGTTYFASIGLPREMYPHLLFQVDIKFYMFILYGGNFDETPKCNSKFRIICYQIIYSRTSYKNYETSIP